MKKRYVFFVNAAYCYAVFRPVQEAIWEEGNEVAWFFTKDTPINLLANEKLLVNEKEVKDFAPDVIFGAGDWIPYYLPGLKVMLFHGLSINKRDSKNNAHFNIRGWYDLYCTHAEHDTNTFSKLAEKHKNFYVIKTGWPKLDPLFNSQTEQTKPKTKQAKILFFASTFSPSITAAPAVADELKSISNLPGWKVIATLHPLMDQDVVEKYLTMQDDSFVFLQPDADLYDAMTQADIMICDTSSIMYEFMFLNKPVITFKTRNPGPFLTDTQKVSDILPTLKALTKDATKQLSEAEQVCKNLHSYKDGKSSQRVLRAVDEVLEQGLGKLKRKPLNLLRKLKLRKRLGYWGF
ncbi:CDP-glycerol glycerophosphotransferase family protein [Marinospirillum insulare]|uniref:CDP-glycerol--glycerophosphate glycerophosphotransferase n=1 Tax=Marinospirillum insulare TaxID=217169 RepID=A0ABQ5ZWJ4_9GAMM|nr:CDP-glycerol glycerophosphotransferase family protein [Marinospirillum insulare]GLR64369.1 CDP-glycerol--glycerophosphate glycerophosphotransferase [Marinospirillum insulare]